MSEPPIPPTPEPASGRARQAPHTVSEAEYRRRLAAVRDLVDRFNALPRVGEPLTDDDLYDEEGLPK